MAMLAYVFWHTSRVDRVEYEDRLATFQAALAADKPEGFIRSAVFVFEQPLPWTPPGNTAYEDWYLVKDFAALGRLNEEAVTGPRKVPHAHVASAAEWGTGGLYRLSSGTTEFEGARHVSWFAKPERVSYVDFYSRVGIEIDLWQRQMTLGPAPEFCMHTSRPYHEENALCREIIPIWTTP